MTTSRPCSDSERKRRRKPEPGAPVAARPRRFAGFRWLPVAIAAATVLTAPVAAQPVGTGTDRRNVALAASLARASSDSFDLGYTAEAIALLDEALGYAPVSSDYLYRRALYGLAFGDPVPQCVELLERALVSDSFVVVSRDDALLTLAGLMLRTKRPERAMSLAMDLADSPQTLYVRALGKLSLGDDDGAAEIIARSLTLYPDDPRALVAWLVARQRPYRQRGSARLVALAFRMLPTFVYQYPEVLIALVPYAPSIDEARSLVRQYRAMGRRSAAATISALKSGLVDDADAMTEMLSGVYQVAEHELAELFSLLSGDVAEGFLQAFSAWKGTLYRDEDRDGYPEAYTSYSGGRADAWQADMDQDGVPEMTAVLVAGEPRSVRLLAGTLSIRYEYDAWPHERSVTFSDGKVSREYTIGYGPILADPVELKALISAGPTVVRVPVRAERIFIPERAVAAAARSVVETAGDRTVLATLDAGTVMQLFWKDASGASGYAAYAAGVPADDRVDADGDGRYEARYLWRASPGGVAARYALEVDADADGLYEYRETLDTPVLQSWDVDNDGDPDILLQRYTDGRTRYRFDTADGTGQAAEIEFADGTILSASVGGAPVPLVPDTGGKVLWLGRKLFDFGSKIPAQGYGTASGSRYRVLEVAGRLYAQVLGP